MIDRREVRVGTIQGSNQIRGATLDCEWACFRVYGEKERLQTVRKLIIKTLKLNEYNLRIYERSK